MSILHAIEELIRERRYVSLADLATHFDMEPSAVEPMVDLLERKRRIKRTDVSCGHDCGGHCPGCIQDDPEQAGKTSASAVILSIAREIS